MRDELRVPVEKLRRICDPDHFSFESTDQVPPVKGFIGQERAVQALELGLEIDNPEYNIFIIANSGISRKSVLLDHLNKFVGEKAALEDGISLNDFCYVHNFKKPDEPRILTFVMGKGRRFQKQIQVVSKSLQKRIPTLLQSDELMRLEKEIMHEFEDKANKSLDQLQKLARESGFDIQQNPNGTMYPIILSKQNPGKVISREEYDGLPEGEKEELDADRKKLNDGILQMQKKILKMRLDTFQKIEELEKTFINEQVLESIFRSRLLKEYSGYPEALDYLQGLKNYVLDNIASLFKPEPGMPGMEKNGEDRFLPFTVNLLVDNSKAKKAPVIFESNPNFNNLFGKIEKKQVQGGYATSHAHLKAGSLLLANGGYLVLNVLDVLTDPGVWGKLKKTIRYGFLKIEEPMSYLGLFPTSLNPEQIPVRLKVILVGEQMLYQLLVNYDPEFSAIFKVKAETDSEMPLTAENEMAYAGFIALCCQKEDFRREGGNLLPFDRSAVAKIKEYGLRLADKQTKLSTEFNKIKELVVESDYWAGKSGSRNVTSEHVKKALEAQRLRANLAENKLQEFIKDKMLLLDTDGKKVGQINGLAVYDLGDYSFGIPSRITAQTFLGRRGVISIDKDVKMSGPIHDKGVHIFLGYFSKKYGTEKPISFSASICFEQSYRGIEGDSASAAELFCLISDLAGLPIKQSIAVTGSVNQKGEIQPIGGVNQKIEGFFDICKERGLNNEQGVIIPHQNVQNLMLREDVVEACQEGKFRVYAIKTVDDGLEILMGDGDNNAEAIHRKVSENLSEMTKKIKEANKEQDKAPDSG